MFRNKLVFFLAVVSLSTSLTHADNMALAKPASVQDRITVITLNVAPDRPDWTYGVGDPVTFKIAVLSDGQPLPGASIQYAIGKEKHEGEWIEATLEAGILEINAGTLNEPGFLRCLVQATINGHRYKGLATAAFDPFQIQPTQTEPADFDQFWEDQLASLKDLPLESTKTLIPEQCTAEVNAYHVSYRTRTGTKYQSRFYGMLAEPKTPGKYPAILQVPGAGIRSYSADTNLAAKGAIVLSLGIHGIPVNLDDNVYRSLAEGALGGYPAFNLHSRESYYYHRVYLGCVRGNDVLTNHPMWDGKNLLATGGSQGGQLSMVTTALDPRVTAVVADFPAFCDVTGYLHHRAGGWPHLFTDDGKIKPGDIETTGYYDVVNFAKRIKVPGSYAWGYNDQICPPTSTFAAYNVITAPKELFLQFDMGHRASKEFNAKRDQRRLEKAGLIDPDNSKQD